MDNEIGTRTTARPEATSRATMGVPLHRSGLDPGATHVTARSSRSRMAAVRGEVCRGPPADGTSSAMSDGCRRAWSCAISAARSSSLGTSAS